MDELAVRESLPLIRTALAEDVGPGDITTQATVPAAATGQGLIVAREPLVAAGLAVATAVFYEVSPRLEVKRLAEDGQRLNAGQGLLRVRGPVAPLLTAERVALNFLQRLTGVATLTRQYVDAVEGTAAIILDTRKTTPGLRRLEKDAVRCGGGRNHRFGLYDAVLIKDNHLEALRHAPPNPVAAAVQRARDRFPGQAIEVEADTLEQVELAVSAGADMILLDNMTLIQLRLAVQLVRGRAKTEASGGVHLSNVRAIAETGVDYISVGALTHSARAMDIALDLTHA
jgi:nicotinate-nucleotide pyrophosphorylase (carboxylating)